MILVAESQAWHSQETEKVGSEALQQCHSSPPLVDCEALRSRFCSAKLKLSRMHSRLLCRDKAAAWPVVSVQIATRSGQLSPDQSYGVEKLRLYAAPSLPSTTSSRPQTCSSIQLLFHSTSRCVVRVIESTARTKGGYPERLNVVFFRPDPFSPIIDLGSTHSLIVLDLQSGPPTSKLVLISK